MIASQVTQSTRRYFDEAAEAYDRSFTDTAVGRAEGEAVWGELGRVFHRGERILELWIYVRAYSPG